MPPGVAITRSPETDAAPRGTQPRAGSRGRQNVAPEAAEMSLTRRYVSGGGPSSAMRVDRHKYEGAAMASVGIPADPEVGTSASIH